MKKLLAALLLFSALAQAAPLVSAAQLSSLTLAQPPSDSDDDEEEEAPAKKSEPTPPTPPPSPGTPTAPAPSAPVKAEPAAPTEAAGRPSTTPELTGVADQQQLVSGAPLFNPHVAVHIVEKKQFSDQG